MKKLKFLSKTYQILVLSDMRNIMHIGQNLLSEWILLEGKKTYILQIYLDFNWKLVTKEGIILKEGEKFDQILKDTGQIELLK